MNREIMGLIPDIPRIYTAIAEWGACMIFIVLLPKRLRIGQTVIICITALVLQTAFLTFTSNASSWQWVLFMLIAFGIMVAFLMICCELSWKDALYCGSYALIIAEFVTSMEWQLFCFYQDESRVLLGLSIFLSCCALFYLFYWWLLHRQVEMESVLGIQMGELGAVLIIVLLIFVVSNMSFLANYVPLSNPFVVYGGAVATVRSLVDLGGLAIITAYYLLRCELFARRELAAVQRILESQYQQYQQSQESIDLINYKYHDLKHQIAALRAENDDPTRKQYLDRMEEEIGQYEMNANTGNKVLDTILAGKAMLCQKNKISLNCVVDGERLNFIDVMDLCSLFGNALDNAIEYETKIADPQKRLIDVAAFAQKGFVIIRIENYFEDELDMKDGLPVTTKEDKRFHGYGLKSIKYIAKKYSGVAKVSVQDHWFEVRILLPVQSCSEAAE